jgi:magnesium-transporting ATPase (P-type)
MLKKYYKILGLMPGASLEDIKKAYRELAKKYHPDVSTEEYAKEKFIIITEAYELLITAKEKGIDEVKPNRKYSRPNAHQKRKTREQEWVNRNKQFARDKGEYYSKMKFKDFIKSDLFKDGIRFYFKKLMLLIACLIITAILIFVLALVSPVLAFIVFLCSILIIIALMTVGENLFTKKR